MTRHFMPSSRERLCLKPCAMLSGSDILSPWLFNFATAKLPVEKAANKSNCCDYSINSTQIRIVQNDKNSLLIEYFNFSYAGLSSSSNVSGGLRSCVGCGGQIHDQYILRVAPNLEWHAACLKCCECQKFLDEKCTCFVREGKIYCKEDYVR